MAEVIDWSPVDESNNSPPPVGAPEHHAPSATNNIMRAMMGAVRRWHDSVNTQLANFLPLSGGTVTGNAGFTGPLGIHIQGTWLDGDGIGNLIVRNVAGGSTAGAVWSIGYGAGFRFGDRDMVSPNWTWHANAGTALFGRVGAAAIITVNWGGQVTVTGNLTATGAVTGNQIFATTGMHAGGSIATDFHVTADGDITAGGAITGNQVFSTLGMHAGGSIGADFHIVAGGDITAGDAITAGGTVRGGYIQSTGGCDSASVGTAYVHCTGHIEADGNVTAAGSVNAAFVNSSGGIHANGVIDSDTNITADGNVTAGGTVTGNAVTANTINATNITGASVVGTTSLATRDAVGDITCGLFTSGTVSYLQFLNQASNANRWEFDGTNGDLQWRSLNAVHWVMRRSPAGSSDNMCFNALGPVGGFGAYYNSSDRRGKEDIESDTCGLDAVLRLNPVSFRRIGQDYRETGFVAQELREVMPDAVRVVGIPLPDDTGGPDDENPTLGVDTTPIIAALVNAVKEMSGRIKTLEGARQ